MELLYEVKDKLASTSINCIRPLKALPEDAPGYIMRDEPWYGVGIPYNGEIIEESFSSARLRTTMLRVGGEMLTLLVLECSTQSVRQQFATLCAEFLAPGANRMDLTSNLRKWWKQWRELLGNAISEKKPYQVLGELLVLEHLIKAGCQSRWMGALGNTKDIETDRFDCEVKSTQERYATQVTISSKFQLNDRVKPIKLAFVRFEPAAFGDSLKSAIGRLVALGCSESELMQKLEKQGIVKGNQAFTTMYNMLEMRFYDVDADFPLITDDSFVGGHMPKNVIDFTYTIDLTGIPYQTEV